MASDRAARVATRFGSPGGTWAGDPKDILAFVEREVKRAVAEEREAAVLRVDALLCRDVNASDTRIFAAIRGRK